MIAPTRAACETIEIALGLHIDTFLQREHGEEVRALAQSGKGFGIVAGTGTGKTLAVRPIAETILGTSLRVGVVNREREATPETPTWNVIIVTTGIARRWFQDGDILPQDTLIVDEIHQTSAELELCLALGKRVGCRFIWLSATVDPTFYARYLKSDGVIQSFAFDPTRAATVKVVREQPVQFLNDKFLQQVVRQKRGVGMFLPTRASVEEAARYVADRFPRVTAAFYHGGEPIRIIRPFLEDGAEKPFFLSMTAAGQSALNVKGLDTVIIDDTRFTNVIERGKNVLTRTHLGANEILQMAGRVHGRVEGGRVFILSDRDIQFSALRPTEPEFQLAGDSERVALTCADLGVRADELDLPIELDKRSYREAVTLLESRGIIDNGRLSRYGKLVEALPVERPWAELIVNAEDDLIPYLAVMSSIESLHRMTREDRDLDGLIVSGSDHLTAYNVYAEAFASAGYMGEVYGLPRHLFDERIDEWAEQRGVLVKAIEDTALAMASVYRGVGIPLPSKLGYAREETRRRFAELLAQFMPFDLVIDEETAEGHEARVSRTSVCGNWGPIAGELRYFADRFGVPRAAIEGTQVPMELIHKYATRGAGDVVYDPRRKQSALAIRRRLEYHGFELDREFEPIDEFPPELEPRIHAILADSFARGEARHGALKRHRVAIEEIREAHRRSGGATPRLGVAELAPLYERTLANVHSLDELRAAPLHIDFDVLVRPEERERWLALPDQVVVRGREVPIDYDVETQDGRSYGVARLRLPEKLARTLAEEELPALDRPLRFTVLRGPRGAVRATTLDELQEMLDRPWSPNEVAIDDRPDDMLPRDERRVRELADDFRRSVRGDRPQRGAGRRDGQRGRSGDGPGGRRDERGGAGRGGPGKRPGGRRRRGR
ncbi:MAG TPA: DEAD/DEAH box helicase [Gemmatimonadaceae bacterium]|nr:DEAD/DEAH box helicase [Gemmatimonadaceae bacterium]